MINFEEDNHLKNMGCYFAQALISQDHPAKQLKPMHRMRYAEALTRLIMKVTETISQETVMILNQPVQAETWKMYVLERLRMHLECLNTEAFESLSEKKGLHEDCSKSIKFCFLSFWHPKIRQWIVSDIALLLLDPEQIKRAIGFAKENVPVRKKEKIENLLQSFFEESATDAAVNVFSAAELLLVQYRKNIQFLQKKPKRIIVTANMSAGKSTLINAIAGRPLFRMAQEVCTSTVGQLYNKAFDDGAVDLSAEKLQLCANVSDLRNTKWEQPVAISVGFVGEFAQTERMCMIDTPGVDAALHERHGQIAYDELKQTEVDRVLYIMNPTNLGTDAEWKHLQWVAQQIPHEKIFFILNKVDDYRPECDDIAQSIESLRCDLLNLGFENPVIYPVSAYFGLSLKMKHSGQQLTEDEEDDYRVMSRRFGRPAYDLSGYYPDCPLAEQDTKYIQLYKRSGLYGLEHAIYGGNHEEDIH